MQHKFKAISCTVDNLKFPSKAERKRYLELLSLKRAGEILEFLMGVPFHFKCGTKYVTDFMIFWSDGNVTIEDVKGVITPGYKLKRRLMAEQYPLFPIVEITYK